MSRKCAYLTIVKVYDYYFVSIRKLRMRNYWFPIRKGGLFVQARKSRDCAEAYIRTPHNFAC